LQQDVRHHITLPDTVTLSGEQAKVLSSGIVTDRFFKRVNATKRRPERVEVEAVPGMENVITQFIVSGRGSLTITVNSTHGGRIVREQSLDSQSAR
jgi:hypothetical protein